MFDAEMIALMLDRKGFQFSRTYNGVGTEEPIRTIAVHLDGPTQVEQTWSEETKELAKEEHWDIRLEFDILGGLTGISIGPEPYSEEETK